MCLDVITERVKPTNKIVVGWKAFKKVSYGQEYQFTNRHLDNVKSVPTGRWLKALCLPIHNTNMTEEYQTGFHVFATKYAADGYTTSFSLFQ